MGTRLKLFGRRIVEFLHKRTHQIVSLLAFGELASGGFFHCSITQVFLIKFMYTIPLANDLTIVHLSRCLTLFFASLPVNVSLL